MKTGPYLETKCKGTLIVTESLIYVFWHNDVVLKNVKLVLDKEKSKYKYSLMLSYLKI
jgi:hypothetical protein